MHKLFALLALLGCVSAQAGELTIRFTGITETKGQVRVALYAFEDDYGKWQAFRSAKTPASKLATITFTDLPKGRYVVSAYQDKNDNGELDKALFGIPTEPYGFSRNPFSRLGPPAFDKAALSLEDAPLETALDLE